MNPHNLGVRTIQLGDLRRSRFGDDLRLSESLLLRVARGDVGAVEACIDRYGGLVWALAQRLLPTAADAEDAVQEVFIGLWQNAGRYDPSLSGEATFIATLARRRLIDRRRRLTARGDSAAASLEQDGVTDGTPPPAELAAERDEVARAAAALTRLAPPQQEALKLAIYQGWTCQRIADHLRQPLGTVKTNIRRGLIRLRELLDATSPAGKEVAS